MKVKRARIAGHGPSHPTDVSLPLARSLPPTAGNPSQEQIASAEAARAGHSLPLSSAGSTLPLLSYRGGQNMTAYITTAGVQDGNFVKLPSYTPAVVC